MAKKQATYADYEVISDDNGKITVTKSGQVLPSAMGALRAIAGEVNFTLDPKWNTQSSGRKLIDFINASSTASAPAAKPAVSAPKPEIKPEPETKQPQKSTAPTPKTTHTPEESETELTEEEMKQIDDLLKRIEALEGRIARMENNQGGASGNDHIYVVKEFSFLSRVYQRDPAGSLVINTSYSVDHKDRRSEVYAEILQGNYRSYEDLRLPKILLLSNGDFVQVGYTITNNSGDTTIRETKAFAVQVGIEASDKATMASLAATIMSQYGRNGWCVGEGTLLDGRGYTFPYTVIDLESTLNDFVGYAGLTEQLPVPQFSGLSVDEKQNILSDYLSRVVSYPLPPKERVIEDFKKACEEYDKLFK